MSLFYWAVLVIVIVYLLRELDSRSKKIELILERLNEVEKNINQLKADVRVAKEFLCYSPTLRNELRTFNELPYSPDEMMLFDVSADKGLLGGLGQKSEVYQDEYEYNEFSYRKHPIKKDGLDMLMAEKETKIINEIFLPVFRKLESHSPEVITQNNIDWLTRGGVGKFELGEYLGWLIPRSKEKGDEAFKKILKELEETWAIWSKRSWL